MRYRSGTQLPFDVVISMSEEEWEELDIQDGGRSSDPQYGDSVFSFYDITERERPDDPDDDDPEDWPIKSRCYRVTRHKSSELPPFNTPIRMPSSRLTGLLIKADGYSDRSDLRDSFFECKFIELNEGGFIYEVVRRQVQATFPSEHER